MSPRTLLALASATLLAAACARANDTNFDEEDESGATGDTSSSGTGTSSSASSSSGPSTGSGEGGAASSTSSGVGGATTGSTSSAGGAGGGTTTTTGSGGNTNTCLHEVCVYGDALTPGCGDPCVDTVCNADDYCCDLQGGEWDDICIEQAVDLCSAQCSTGPAPGDLVITEIMNNPSSVADNQGEWFELKNVSSSSIDLSGLVIRHQGITVDPNAMVTINQSVVIPAGGYVVLGLNGNTATNGGINVDYVYPSNVNLSNTSDYLAIEDGLGTIIDEVSYDSASGLNPNGKSRNLDPSFLNDIDNDDDTHFCEATSTMGAGDKGTPAGSNDPCP